MRGRKLIFPLALAAILVLLILSIQGRNIVARQGWGMLSVEIMVIALALCYWGFEQGRVSSREVALIAVLGAVAAVGRVPFAALPNIQPVTFMVIISGFVFGSRAGFMTGSTAALVSNFFLGQGPWTPWQMFAWGLAGVTAGLIRMVFPRTGTAGMTVFCIIWGYLYGWIMNLWFWTAFVQPLNWQSFAATYAASFWFDTFHAAGNAAFYLFFGASFKKILARFRRKLEVNFIESIE
ncbi:ECF transporter S component [Desulfotomaculum copahuensis]|uniref:ECF transporter S component n=1 Tax=Desulfotomaculum copahuensis TaxID=1838280 RepID=A0A1B7LE04_9FIRM|nr:ECF transporter S component [Desulfotomaculum copahuensis]OAT81316.1 ECF transporter S component [Desulfotomaculum copahuensis]